MKVVLDAFESWIIELHLRAADNPPVTQDNRLLLAKSIALGDMVEIDFSEIELLYLKQTITPVFSQIGNKTWLDVLQKIYHAITRFYPGLGTMDWTKEEQYYASRSTSENRAEDRTDGTTEDAT